MKRIIIYLLLILSCAVNATGQTITTTDKLVVRKADTTLDTSYKVMVISPNGYTHKSYSIGVLRGSGGGGTTYTAGTCLTIRNDTVFVDTTCAKTKLSAYYDSLALAGQIIDSQTAMYTYLSTLISNYYTKTESDARYLQSFTETDPVFRADSLNLKHKRDSVNSDGYVPVNRWTKNNIVVTESINTKYNTADTGVFKNKGDSVNYDGYVPVNRWTKNNIVVTDSITVHRVAIDSKANIADTNLYKRKSDTLQFDGYTPLNKAQKDSAVLQAKIALETLAVVAARGNNASTNIDLRMGVISSVAFMRKMFFGGSDGNAFATSGAGIQGLSYGAWAVGSHPAGLDFSYTPFNSATPLIHDRTDAFAIRYFGTSVAALGNVANQFRYNFLNGGIYAQNSIKTPDTILAGNITIKNAIATSTPSKIYVTEDTVVKTMTIANLINIAKDSLALPVAPILTYPDFAKISGVGTTYNGSFYGAGFWIAAVSIGANADGGFLINNFPDSAQNSVACLDTAALVSGYSDILYGITFNSTTAFGYDGGVPQSLGLRSYLFYLPYKTAADSTMRYYGSNDGYTFTLLYTAAAKTSKQLNLTIRGIAANMVPKLGAYNATSKICIIGTSVDAKLYGQDSVGKSLFNANERRNGYNIKNIAVGGATVVNQMNTFLALPRWEQLSFSAVVDFTGLNNPNDSPAAYIVDKQLLVDTVRSLTRPGLSYLVGTQTPVSGSLTALQRYHFRVMRDNIMGTGANPLLRVGYRFNGHTNELSTPDDRLKPNYFGLEDGVHISSLGKRVVDRWIADALIKTKILDRVVYKLDTNGLFQSQNQTSQQLTDLIAFTPAVGSSFYCTDCYPAGLRTWNGTAWVGNVGAVDSLYRKAATDSVFFVKNGASVFAYKDSTAAAGSGVTSVTATYPVVSGGGTTPNITLDTTVFHSFPYSTTFFPQLGGSYSNPSWITSLSGGKITGAYTSSTMTMNTNRILARTTASSGLVEEITPNYGLTMASGNLVVDTTGGKIATQQYVNNAVGAIVSGTSISNGTYTTVSGTGTLLSPYVIDITTGIPATYIGGGTVDNTEYGYVNGVTSAIQTQLDGKVDENGAITGATKTKITYDAKGLVTGGADATTADIAPSTNRNYVTDAQQTVIGNTSGTNTGDQTAVTGNAGSATTTAITDDASTNATMYPTWVTAATGNLPQKVSSTKLTYNPSTGSFSSTSFVGALTGNASTATALQTARAIYGNNFDGSAALTQIIASTYGGTGNGFTKFTGPATSEKTFTLPNASATILTDNAAVTVAQGGTGATTLTGVLKGNGTSAFTSATAGTDYSAGTSALATGILKSTTTTGGLSIAVAADFPTLNQNTTGSAATLTTTRTIWGQNFNGSANVSGTLALGSADLTLTGSVGATGARATKVWATDIESTNVPTVGGTALPTATSTTTFTNKRITKRIGTTASSATPTPDADAHDVYTVTALAVNATFGAPTGTPTDGQGLIIRAKDNATPRTLAFNAAYRFSTDITAPTTTVAGKTIYLGFIWNAADSKWDCVAKIDNF